MGAGAADRGAHDFAGDVVRVVAELPVPPLLTTNSDDENPRPFHLFAEEKAIAKVSFMVCVPSITIPTQEFDYMLSYAVNTYRTAGKTYLIKIDGEELKPNKTKS